MSGITFVTSPAQSQTATAPASDHAVVKEQSFRSAVVAQPAPLPPTSTSYEAGPGLTTLAIGEEDGGAMSATPEPESMSTPTERDNFQVTTLAIGEEDGGGSGQVDYGTMRPIGDDHSIIGGGVQTTYSAPNVTGGSPGNYGTMQPIYSPGEAGYPAFAKASEIGGSIQTDHIEPIGMNGLPEGYGTMQPIYSPGEAEYSAFAKTSETTDLLNFNPVARIPKTQVTNAPLTVPPPASVQAPIAAQPVAMEAKPVGALTQDVPISGNYESIGSYDNYIQSLSGESAAPTTQSAATVQEPAYEAHQPVAASSTYESAAKTAPTYEPIGSASVQTAPTPAAPVEATPVETVASVNDKAPMTSAEPLEKPAIYEKDAPFDFKTDVEPADPADGNPNYVAPSEATTDTAATAKPESSYVEVPIDAYLVEPAGSETLPPDAAKSDSMKEAEATPSGQHPSEVTASTEAKTPASPISASNTSDATVPEKLSLGGSYRVIGEPLPQAVTGASSGMGSAGPEAAGTAKTGFDVTAPDTSSNGLQIITLSTGEESGSP